MVNHRVYLAGVASRAHLVYAASWLRRLDGDVDVEVLTMRTFLDSPELGLGDVRAMLPEGIDVTAFDGSRPARGERLTLLCVGAVGIKPWLRLHRAVGGRRLHVVTTDEGFGTYGDWFSRRGAWRREGVREPWLSLRTSAVLGASAVLTSSRWRLYRRTRSGWQVNAAIADEFRRYVTRTSNDGGAVFLTQPWPELGVLDERAYVDHVTEVATACRKADLDFTVHPHPAEDPTRYRDFHVHTGHGLAELDQAVVNATVLLGATSTAMLNVASIHGVPVVRTAFDGVDALEATHSARQQDLLVRQTGAFVTSEDWPDKLAGLSTPTEQE